MEAIDPSNFPTKSAARSTTTLMNEVIDVLVAGQCAVLTEEEIREAGYKRDTSFLLSLRQHMTNRGFKAQVRNHEGKIYVLATVREAKEN